MNTPVEPWYNIFGGRYNGSEPNFYDTSQFPWVKILEDNWQVIRNELTSLIADDPKRLQPYYINKSMAFPPNHWKTMGLYFWRFKIHKNCRRCPKTVKILKQIPNLTAASLSILEPNSNINPHQGDTDAVIRGHLGLSVPGSTPECGFQVGQEIKSWETGKVFLFCDARSHSAWNNTDERRLVMIFDVMRDEFVDRKNSVCAHVLADAILQMAYQAMPKLHGFSGRFKKVAYVLLKSAIKLILPIQRRLGISKVGPS
jgi:aspartyl/asparaginyl beta-hydroxylase (cupin superfamily)